MAARNAGAGAHVWRTDDGDVTILAAGPDASAWTLQVMVSADEVSARPDVPLTLRTWEDLFHRRTGWQHVRFVDSGPVSSYPVRPHVADALRADRVFLAGDAAHGGPRGGTGLDAGLQDAYNLGWKLDAVVRGAGDDLVDSYEAERLPVARSLLGQPADLFLALLEEAGSEAAAPARPPATPVHARPLPLVGVGARVPEVRRIRTTATRVCRRSSAAARSWCTRATGCRTYACGVPYTGPTSHCSTSCAAPTGR